MMEALDIFASASLWGAVLRIATPLIFGTLGALICERAGKNLKAGVQGHGFHLEGRGDRFQQLKAHFASARAGHHQPLVPAYVEPASYGFTRAWFGLFGHVPPAARRGEHFESGPQKVVQPDSALCARHLVAQVHAAAERPADLELPDRAVGVAHQADRAVLGCDGVDLGVGPTECLDGPDLFADKVREISMQ